MSTILAIDIGTSSAKALVVNEHGDNVFSVRKNYPTDYPQDDWSEQNPEEIYRTVIEIIKACPEEIKDSLTAISFSSAMHSVMAVDERGTALTPVIIWSDLRSKKESAMLRNTPGMIELLAKTGTPVHPMSPLCKIMWLRDNQPEVFARAFKFIGIKEYIWYKFFHEFEVDYGIASATGLFLTGTLTWFDTALALAGIDASCLSQPVSVYSHRLLSDQRLLEEFGFRKSLPCIIGSSDGCLANLGSEAMQPDVLSLTIGTSGAVRRVVGKNIPDKKGRIFLYHLDDEVLVEGGATNNGAALLSWYTKNFIKEGISVSDFIKRACSVSAGSDGLLFAPYVFGERAPIYNPEASGVFFGIRHYHTMEHFMRAILEGIGFALYSIADLLEENNGPYKAIIASGGFTQSPEWVQIIADIFGKPVRVTEHDDASAVGAAMLGFQALGVKYSCTTPSAEFTPNETMHALYLKQYTVYKQLTTHLQDMFHTLSKLKPLE